MDIRTGETYPTLEEALAAGVPRSDIALVTERESRPPTVKFSKHVFGSLKNVAREPVEK